ncbi:MAG: hypothetical protein OSJ69_06515 [Acetatifactor sp.]|nr:hypothetical protein [Acetatifactor sp.]
MDINGANGITGAGMGQQEMPIGLGFALAANEPAMKGYAALTEAEKEQLLLRCKDAKSKDEMQRIVDSLVPDTDVRAIMEEEKLS